MFCCTKRGVSNTQNVTEICQLREHVVIVLIYVNVQTLFPSPPYKSVKRSRLECHYEQVNIRPRAALKCTCSVRFKFTVAVIKDGPVPSVLLLPSLETERGICLSILTSTWNMTVFKFQALKHSRLQYPFHAASTAF